MKKAWCWLVTGVLLLPTFTAYAGNNPRIITLDGQYQLGTDYNTDFGNNGFFTAVCENPTQIQGIQAWGGTSYIRLGDFNGNGRLDIASPQGPWVLIKLSQFDPLTFSFSNCLEHLGPSPVANTWGGAQWTWVGDFNGDNKDDLASASADVVYMKLSNPGGGFTGFDSQTWSITTVEIPMAPWTGPLWGGSDYTWVGDFDGDGDDDIASAIGGSVRVHLSNGNHFLNRTWNVTNDWGPGAWTRVGDFNGDDKADIASVVGGTIRMKISHGSGFLNQNWPVANTWGSSAYTWVADFNKDGLADFASANAAAGVVHMKLSTGTSFNSVDWLVSNQWGGPQYTWVVDYDSDGYKDIVSAFNGWTIVTKRNVNGTGFSGASWNYFGWWGPAENTWALDYSRYSPLSGP